MNTKWGPRTSNTLSEVPTACPSPQQLTRPDLTLGPAEPPGGPDAPPSGPAGASRHPVAGCSTGGAEQAATGPRIPAAGHTRGRPVAGCSTGSAQQAATGPQIPPADQPAPGPRARPTTHTHRTPRNHPGKRLPDRFRRVLYLRMGQGALSAGTTRTSGSRQQHTPSEPPGRTESPKAAHTSARIRVAASFPGRGAVGQGSNLFEPAGPRSALDAQCLG